MNIFNYWEKSLISNLDTAIDEYEKYVGLYHYRLTYSHIKL